MDGEKRRVNRMGKVWERKGVGGEKMRVNRMGKVWGRVELYLEM